MTNTATEAPSVVVEREIPFPPEKIWRALTQPHLIEEWDWGVVDCQVLAVEPNKTGVLHVGCLWSRECRHLDSRVQVTTLSRP